MLHGSDETWRPAQIRETPLSGSTVWLARHIREPVRTGLRLGCAGSVRRRPGAPLAALITGLSLDGLTDDPDSPRGRSAAAFVALAIQQDQLLVREAAASFAQLPRDWREASATAWRRSPSPPRATRSAMASR